MKIFKDYDIKNESTFRIGGIVKEVAFPETVDELIQIITEYDLVLGNCSNILFSSGHINKKIILTKCLTNYKIEDKNIYVECGAKGPIVSNEAKEHSLTGFEFLAGFPGTFGGMIYMNASAHNQSISDCFVKARIFDSSKKEVITMSKEEMKFDYRKSILTNTDNILLDAQFQLNYGNKEQINEIMQRNILFRKEKQPSLKMGNAGSIFKNPENDSAGRLLDLCNLKGEFVNGAKVFEGHANFIVNTGSATSEDVLLLMKKMYDAVEEKYTIKLQPEVKYIGDKETKEYLIWKSLTENMVQTLK